MRGSSLTILMVLFSSMNVARASKPLVGHAFHTLSSKAGRTKKIPVTVHFDMPHVDDGRLFGWASPGGVPWESSRTWREAVRPDLATILPSSVKRHGEGNGNQVSIEAEFPVERWRRRGGSDDSTISTDVSTISRATIAFHNLTPADARVIQDKLRTNNDGNGNVLRFWRPEDIRNAMMRAVGDALESPLFFRSY